MEQEIIVKKKKKKGQLEIKIPAEQDISPSQFRSPGIVENLVTINMVTFRLLDVGGQKNDRKKWLPCFEYVSAIIFVVAISDYDQFLLEDDEKINRMDDALNFFSSVVNSRWFETPVITLIFNKCEVFREKIKQVPLTVAFPNYVGENTYDEGYNFIKAEFLKRNYLEQRSILVMPCTGETQSINQVFVAIKELVINASLARLG